MKKTKKKLYIAVNIIVLLFSLILIISGSCPTLANSFWSTFLIGVGCSLLASVVIAFINLYFQNADEKYSNLIDTWGLENIYKNRSQMNPYSNNQIKNAHSLEICAMGLKSFRDAETELIKKRIKNGMTLHVLTIDPKSEFTNAVDKSEGLSVGSTRQTIEDLIKWFEELKSLQKYDGQIELRVYNHYPYEFYFCIDDNMYIGPYQEKTSQQTITYYFKNKSEGFDYYKTHFNHLWSQYDSKQGV